MADRIDLDHYYTASQAAEVLSKNSGKPVDVAYVRMLVKYGKFTPRKITARMSLYPKKQVDAYIVTDRGEKAAQAAKDRAAKARRKKEARGKKPAA